jgi:hypothetical protein
MADDLEFGKRPVPRPEIVKAIDDLVSDLACCDRSGCRCYEAKRALEEIYVYALRESQKSCACGDCQPKGESMILSKEQVREFELASKPQLRGRLETACDANAVLQGQLADAQKELAKYHDVPMLEKVSDERNALQSKLERARKAMEYSVSLQERQGRKRESCTILEEALADLNGRPSPTPDTTIPIGAKLHSTIDAEVWAKEFMNAWGDKIYQTNGECIDLDLMRTWFANAIMCGFDIANQRHAEKPPDLDLFHAQRNIVRLTNLAGAFEDIGVARRILSKFRKDL